MPYLPGLRYLDHRIYPSMMVSLITDLDAAERAVHGHRLQSRTESLKYLVAESVMDRTDAEDNLEDPRFVDFEMWRALPNPHYARRPPPRRVAVSLHITKARNLSVTVHPLFYGEDGNWTRAPEWRIAFDRLSTPIMRRPPNEILFVRDAERLFEPIRRIDPDELVLRRLEAKAVHFAFHAAVTRIAHRFDVAIAGDLELVEAPPLEAQLAIVDTRQRDHVAIAERVSEISAEHGYSPDRLWATFETCRDNGIFGDAKASRLLRTAEGPASGLTPATVRHLHALLRRAKAYGIFEPAPCEPVTPPAVVPPPREHRLPARRPAPVPRPDPRPLRVHAPPPRAGLSYAGMTAAPLPPDLAAQFDAASTEELVERINALYAKAGERPLPQGSFPTTRAKLRSFLSLYRDEKARLDP